MSQIKTANGRILSNIRISVSPKLLVFSSQHHRVVIILLASRRGCQLFQQPLHPAASLFPETTRQYYSQFEFFYFPETPPETTNAIASELSILSGVTRPEGKINTEPAKLYDCGK